MHEGLIVLDQKDKSVKFASAPAVRRLKSQSVSDETPIKSELNELDFQQNLFKPTPVSVNNVGEIDNELNGVSGMTFSDSSLISLNTIVETQEQQREENGNESTMSGAGLVYRSRMAKKAKKRPLPTTRKSDYLEQPPKK